MSRRGWIGAGVLGTLALAAGVVVFGTGPLVHAAVARRAERYGATVSIERVRLTWQGVRLEGVEVSVADAPGVRIRLAAIDVVGGRFRSVTRISIRGGEIVAVGIAAELRAQLHAVMARPPPTNGTGAAAVPFSLAGVSVRWAESAGAPEMTASGVAIDREGSLLGLKAEVVEGKREAVGGRVSQLSFTFRRGPDGWRPDVIRAESVEAEVTLALPPAPAIAAAPPPVMPKKPAGKAHRAAATVAKVEGPPSFTVRLAEAGVAARARLHQGVALVSQVLAGSPPVEVTRARVIVRRGADVLHVGPGTLKLAVEDDRVVFSLRPSDKAAGAPLQLSADVPLDAAKDVSVTIQGGPVPLSALGLGEHDLGLLDVGSATIEAGGRVGLTNEGRHLDVALRGKLRGLSISHPKLSSEPIRGLDLGFAVEGGGNLDARSIRVAKAEIELGTVHAEVHGELDRHQDGYSVHGVYAIPLASCSGLIDALPHGLAPKLHGMKMSGTFALNGKVNFDSRKPDAADLGLVMLNECRVVEAPPDVDVARFRGPYRRAVYTPDGQIVEIDSGPGTPGWVPFGGISPFMEAAVLTTEDGRFRSHRGFDLEAIRNSIRENLKAGRFVRGASTISMQTAKNVYLKREKTLSRKLQEAVLTAYLEQALSKEQILELYLNSIEFGPMIYGIGPAAAHYFHTSAGQLSLGQALYLSSILPNPKIQHFGPDGRVSAGWMGYLHRLMRGMAKRRLVAEADVADGLLEWVVLGESRPVRARPTRDGEDDGPLPDQ